jgi:hypothetical protein
MAAVLRGSDDMHTASIIRSVLRGESVPGVIPLPLLGTHRVMERWAVSNGSGLPTELWDDRKYSRPPPLDDDTATVVDQIVLHLPTRTRRIVEVWYCKPLPTIELAAELGMSKSSLDKAHAVTLNFLKWKFERTEYKPLLKLLRIGV